MDDTNRMGRPPRRPKNGGGTGHKAIVSFQPDDPSDRRALKMYRQLTGKRRFSGVVKEMLVVLADIQDSTGEILDVPRTIALLHGAMMLGVGAAVPPRPPEAQHIVSKLDTDELLPVRADAAPTHQSVAATFAASLSVGNDDDLWD